VRICLVHCERVPPTAYGGTERIVHWLGTELARRGHEITLLAPEGSIAPFGTHYILRGNLPLTPQIPGDVDVVHFHFPTVGSIDQPYLVTNHGNLPAGLPVDRNTVFVSENHAQRHGASCFVRNGLDPDEYGPVNWSAPRSYVHFLGKAAWRRKNVKGAIDVARLAGLTLVVMGGTRLNFNMGFRFTLDPGVRFEGMIAGERKNQILNGSRGLIFPVRWHEPFGLAIIESLYFGCPVLGTPYGALPELVPPDVGFLSNSRRALVDAAKNLGAFSHKRCHEWVMDCFSVRVMTDNYLRLYARVISGEPLNELQPMAVLAPSNALDWVP
jgi:glycosyltransferase involved in cell wall biosynthesis